MKKSIRKTTPSLPVNPGILHEVSEEREDHAVTESAMKIKYSSDESSDEEDIRMLEGNVYTKDGIEVTTILIDARSMRPCGDITAMVYLDLEEERRQCEAHQGGN